MQQNHSKSGRRIITPLPAFECAYALETSLGDTQRAIFAYIRALPGPLLRQAVFKLSHDPLYEVFAEVGEELLAVEGASGGDEELLAVWMCVDNPVLIGTDGIPIRQSAKNARVPTPLRYHSTYQHIMYESMSNSSL
ncbi:hypothetical protein PG995_006082 [Apiospora arundinis]